VLRQNNPNVTSNEARLAIIEERISNYEAVISKMDEAIEIMVKTSYNISKMLAVHEEKMNTTSKNEEILLERVKDNEKRYDKLDDKIEEVKEELKKYIDTKVSKIDGKLDTVNSKIGNVISFKDLIYGGVMIFVFAVSNPTFFSGLLTPSHKPATIERSVSK